MGNNRRRVKTKDQNYCQLFTEVDQVHKLKKIMHYVLYRILFIEYVVCAHDKNVPTHQAVRSTRQEEGGGWLERDYNIGE